MSAAHFADPDAWGNGGRTRTISDPYTTWNAWAEGATLLEAA